MCTAAEYLDFKKKLFFLTVFCFLSTLILGQNKISFKDSIDNKLDLSDWVITSKGFIPIPYLITEPALGGIGGALFPVFIKPNTPYRDSIDGKIVKTRAKPNIYALGGAYTANGTWLVGGGAAGTIKKWRANYRLGSGYADINMNFYKTFQNGEEKSFEFNLKTIPIYGQFTKQIGLSSWSAGLNYLFLNTTLGKTNSEFNTQKEVSSNVSRLGLLFEFDKRDNFFTPDKGLRWNTTIASSDEIIGSDYGFTSFSSAAYWYVPVSKSIISGYRAEYQQVFGSPPFYMKPFIAMRGIPVMRYQGNIVALAETEWRWDFTSRHSLIGFGGTAKAIADGDTFQDSNWRVSGGVGWRYLLARKLKLRAGIDVARGPEEWAYYIVFGTNWIK